MGRSLLTPALEDTGALKADRRVQVIYPVSDPAKLRAFMYSDYIQALDLHSFILSYWVNELTLIF